MRTLAVNQPTHFPWLGYFDLVWTADIFVVYGHVQFSRHIEPNSRFAKKHLLAIRANDAPTPHFETYYSELEAVYGWLVEFNRDLIAWGFEKLGVKLDYPDFVSHLSCVDYLFKVGPEGIVQ